MELKTKFENGTFNTYDSKKNLIGKIKINPKANFIDSEIIIDNKIYQVLRKKWETKIIDDGKSIFHLKTNSLSGNTEIKELNKKIKGVWGLKWGTQLTDENGETLLKIRNENKWSNNRTYIINLQTDNLTPLEILISIYGHLYGSSMKQKAVLIGIIAAGVSIWFF